MSATQSNSRPPKSGAEYKKWNEERKARKRKWKEERLMKDFEKQRAVKQQEADDASKTSNDTKSQPTETTKGDITKCSFTVSIAVPGSILDNAQSPELRTYLVGQIARAAAVFNVDEIVVYDEAATKPRASSAVTDHKPTVQMAHVLQYLECPQYLRKNFFPQHSDLKFAGLLNPLCCPHHMSQSDETPYREGVVLNKPVRDGKGSFVNVGLMKEIQIDKQLQPGVRVTVRMNPVDQGEAKRKGCVVSPLTPKTESGIYWGYTTRLASSLSAVFTESTFPDGYDLIIGTSERGTDVDSFSLPQFRHLLIVFGGLAGLEACVEADENLRVSDASLLFHHYLNTCPQQGSNTIRTEEAVLITLSSLRPKLRQCQTVDSSSVTA